MTTAPFEPDLDPDQIPGEPAERPDPVAPGEPAGPDRFPVEPDQPDPSPTES